MTVRRLCFVTTFYPPFGFGGDGIAIQRLAQALARRGHDVTVVHDADAFTVLGGRAVEEPTPDPFGVRVVTLRTRHPLLSTLLTQQTGHPVVNGPALKRLLDDEAFDVVVFNNVSLIGGPGVLRYGGAAARIYLAHEHWLVCPSHVLWRHNRERCEGRECLRCQLHYRRPPQLWRYTNLLDRELAHVDTFVAMSEFSRDKHRQFGFGRAMEVLPYFLPDPPAEPPALEQASPHDRPYVLFVGRLERLKGLDDVIPAFGGYEDADLLVVGDGTHGEALHRLARGNARVRFVGRVPNHQLGSYYRHALALLVPSVGFETFGITLIEGFSHGLPVIARRVGPLPEIVGRSGGGVLFDTPAELVAGLAALQRDPCRRAALGRAGYDAYRQYWCESVVVPRYIALFEDAYARRRARAS
jgi:glycosyltransferase involved in cell wall biosynthesis